MRTKHCLEVTSGPLVGCLIDIKDESTRFLVGYRTVDRKDVTPSSMRIKCAKELHTIRSHDDV